MDELRLESVAASVAAWHNRHPLARRIGLPEVQSIGFVRLPFARGPKGLKPAFSEDFMPPWRPARVARWAARHGREGVELDTDVPRRDVAVDRALLGAAGGALVVLTVRTAEVDAGGEPERVLLGPGARPAVLGRRLASVPRLGGAVMAGVLALAGAWQALGPGFGPGAAPAAVVALAASAPAGGASGAVPGVVAAAASAAVDAAPASAAADGSAQGAAEGAADAAAPGALAAASAPEAPAVVPAPHQAAEATPTAAPPAPAAKMAQAETLQTPEKAHTPDKAKKPEKPERPEKPAPPALPPDDGPPEAAAQKLAAVARPAAAPAQRPADVEPRWGRVELPPKPYIVDKPKTPVYGLASGVLRTEGEGERVQGLMARLLAPAAPPGVHVERLQVGEDWRVVGYPFNDKAEAERVAAVLLKRGLRTEVIDF